MSKYRSIDTFGDVRVDGGTPYRARLIRLDDVTYAAFTEADPTVPIMFTAVADPGIRGRVVSVELIGGGLLEFRRASCGCQTPRNLRGPRSKFTVHVPNAAPEEAEANA